MYIGHEADKLYVLKSGTAREVRKSAESWRIQRIILIGQHDPYETGRVFWGRYALDTGCSKITHRISHICRLLIIGQAGSVHIAGGSRANVRDYSSFSSSAYCSVEITPGSAALRPVCHNDQNSQWYANDSRRHTRVS